MLNISPLIVWVVALSQLLTFGLTVWNLLASGSRANARTLEAHGETLHGLDARLSAVEMSMKGMPGKDEMHQLSISLADLRGDIRAMGASVDGQRQILTRLESVVSRQEDHLMRSKS
ncbi:DUF2730 family protein [Paracoccus sp. (in: a-proteobacteria)]|uniref:DUF2730 family protein n=1 Tax=Paracoccus sp. TaxID=267 RepID=UPI00272B5A9A|nr:DUF2730 family protein [Paracoccus sp. (in: a-proteobacteria)]